MSTPLIQTRQLTISFGAHKAVNNVSIEIEKDIFTTIIGPNGAGKTTLFNLISGLLRPTGGQVLFKGTDITHLSPLQRVALGMGRSFQLTNVFPALTVQENVRLALQAQARIGYRIFADHRKFRQLNEKTGLLLEQVLLQEKKISWLLASPTVNRESWNWPWCWPSIPRFCFWMNLRPGWPWRRCRPCLNSWTGLRK